MVRSAQPTVAGYIAEQPDAWKPTLRKLRALCRRELPGYRETMAFGMPSYARRGGDAEVAFAKQARYLSFYVFKQSVLDAHRRELESLDVGKSCIRYSRPERIDWDIVTRLLVASAASNSEIC